MDDSGYRFGVGVLVLASIIIGVLLIAFFGAVPAFWVDRYQVSFRFDRAPKVSVDTPVRKNGVLIGRVSNIVLLPGDGGVTITMDLDRKYELQKAEVPRISTDSIITGEAVVEFIAPSFQSLLKRFDGILGAPRDGELDPQERAASLEIMPGAYYSIGGEVAPDPQEIFGKVESQLLPVLTTLERAFNRVDAIGASVQNIIGDGATPFQDIVSTVQTTAQNVNQTVSTINTAAGSVDRVVRQIERADIPAVLERALVELPVLFKSAEETLAQTQRTLKGFEKFSLSLEGLGKEFDGIGETIREAVENANVAIENIASITEPVKQNSEQLVGNAVQALENLNKLSIDLRTFTGRLNRGNGTIAQLIDNPQLYYAVTNAVRNIEQSSGEIQVLAKQLQPAVSRLQPILNDVRIFTDKVSRDPGQLGVRGALNNRPTGLGLK
jgi:phospholipid/cholesterol/gamma-HCH transport system substrate-binding protein